MHATDRTALILDDDPWMGELLTMKLRQRLPHLEIETRTRPDTSGEFDAYFVDNKFAGVSFAAELVREIRREAPDAVVAVLSGDLGRLDILELANASCDVVCEKSALDRIDAMIETVAQRIEQRDPRTRRSRPGGFGAALRSLVDLVSQLNERLETSTERVR